MDMALTPHPELDDFTGLNQIRRRSFSCFWNNLAAGDVTRV